MRHTLYLWIAAGSLLVGADRPRYGGVLRVETRATVMNLDPADMALEPQEAAAKEKLIGQVFETLVRLDDKGEAQPLLATSWTHDTAKKRWVFEAREKVEFHNGAAWSPPGGVVTVPDDQPIEQILRELAKPKNAVVLRLGDGGLAGTGPFKVTQFEAGKSAVLAAHERHWAGRPFLDGIEVQMGRPYREQALDFELGKSDVVELPVTEVRRARQRGVKVAVTKPVEVLALVLDPARGVSDGVREALALSMDRVAMQSVLLQKMGEASAALAPQWLSGYAFVFSAERNLERARQLAAGSAPVSFSYDRQDAVMQSVGERIALNAGEAGITMRAATGNAQVKLVRLRATAMNVQTVLEDFARMLGAQGLKGGEPYEQERSLLEGFRVIPVIHLPACYELGGRVRQWGAAERWDLSNVWLGEVQP